MKVVTIYRPDNTISVFEKGQNLIKNKKKTDIKVMKITYLLNTVKVYLSNGETLMFRGMPFVIN